MSSFSFSLRTFAFTFVFLCLFSISTRQVLAVGPNIGILGDSNTDEYRGSDNRAGSTQYAATTLNWLELLVNTRGFNVGPWGSWGEPRRSGYEYNWSRSAATSDDMISSGQHTGLAQQIAAGKVQYVIIFIGSNDFNTWNGTYAQVYNGTLSSTQVQQKVNRIISNITTAVDTVKQAGNVKIALLNYGDPGQSVQFRTEFPDATKRQKVTNAIISVNQGLSQLAQSRQIELIDLYNFGTTIFARVDTSGDLTVGGEKITLLTKGNEPHHLQLDDSVGHSGTVGSGLIGNYILTALNTEYGLNVPLYSDQEILINAGIMVATLTPTRTPTRTPTGTQTICTGDISGDSTVDLADYSILVQNFLKSPLINSKADLTNDGTVDLSDYSVLVSHFLKPCS